MRYMIIVKASRASEAGERPKESMFAVMASYHEELQQAGVLLDASGLAPTNQGFRVVYEGGTRTVVDGPFPETKELIAGYTLIQVKSREEAVEWARRFPNPHDEDCHIEVRRLFELDDFGPSEQVDRFREMEKARSR